MIKTYTLLIVVVLGLAIACERSPNHHSDHTVWADSTAERATNLMDGKNPALAMRYLDSAYHALRKPGIGDLWKKYKVKAIYYTYYKQDFVNRRLYIDSMFTILKSKETTYPYEYAHTLYTLANLLQEEKKYNHAFKVYYDGRNFSKGSLDNCSLSDFSNALGIIRYRQEQYQQAIPYFKQAYREVSSCSNPVFQYSFIQRQSALNSIALCFEKTGRSDSAIFYYNRALEFIKASFKQYPHKQDFITTARAVVEGNLGGAYGRLNRFEEAEKHLQTNIQLNDRPGFSIEDAQTAKTKLVKLYIGHNRLPKAKSLLNELESDLVSGRGKSSSHGEIWESWYQLKWQYYDKVGDLAGAYRFSKKYHAYRDSLDRLNNGLKNVDIDQVLREHDQKYRLSLLEKSSELQNTYVIGLSVFLGMALCLAFVIWLSYHRSRTNVKNLTELNGQMQQALSALENSQRENARLMKIVAHDLRNPIGAMSSMAELMLDDDNRAEEDRGFLKLIKDSGTNSLELVNNLLHMSGTSEKHFAKEEVNLADLVQHCADMLALRAADKQQYIRLNLQPAVLWLNYEKMWRVVSNLISNAIKFSPEGSVIEIAIEKNRESVQLIVKDEGIGIPPEVGSKIFDVFTESKRKGTSGEESFGLGLSITKQIVEAHAGKISFESVPNQGTTFKIVLPEAGFE
ncbi:tetratricopeptide repeat-containing sensor histidine kinase [Larkinella sp. GY13]|uniref:tetratricopeptide repeat-containing sensor histidine kinase n=1 Tax=Larkinella sp. GY13 TaxID=3453720 RepID=UPI003EEDABB2